jgi:amino acid transporter
MLPLSALYLLVTYCLVSLQNRGVIGAQVDGLTVPFSNIAQAIHRPWLGPLSSIGVALSYFACGLASLTVASRVLFSMARDRQFWVRFSEAHPRNATPHRAIAVISIGSMAIPVIMLACGADLSMSISFLSQLGSLGLIGGYFMVVVALPIYLRRRRLLRVRDVMIAVAASLMLVLVLFLSIYPRPPAPFNYLIYIFAACTLCGVSISKIVSNSAKSRLSQVADPA